MLSILPLALLLLRAHASPVRAPNFSGSGPSPAASSADAIENAARLEPKPASRRRLQRRFLDRREARIIREGCRVIPTFDPAVCQTSAFGLKLVQSGDTASESAHLAIGSVFEDPDLYAMKEAHPAYGYSAALFLTNDPDVPYAPVRCVADRKSGDISGIITGCANNFTRLEVYAGRGWNKGELLWRPLVPLDDADEGILVGMQPPKDDWNKRYAYKGKAFLDQKYPKQYDKLFASMRNLGLFSHVIWPDDHDETELGPPQGYGELGIFVGVVDEKKKKKGRQTSIWRTRAITLEKGPDDAKQIGIVSRPDIMWNETFFYTEIPENEKTLPIDMDGWEGNGMLQIAGPVDIDGKPIKIDHLIENDPGRPWRPEDYYLRRPNTLFWKMREGTEPSPPSGTTKNCHFGWQDTFWHGLRAGDPLIRELEKEIQWEEQGVIPISE